MGEEHGAGEKKTLFIGREEKLTLYVAESSISLAGGDSHFASLRRNR
jgi:hypothetical protein